MRCQIIQFADHFYQACGGQLSVPFLKRLVDRGMNLALFCSNFNTQ